MKKIILALVTAAGIFAMAPAPASATTATTGIARSTMDANAQLVVVRPGGFRGERRMERRRMERRIDRRMERRMDRRMDRRRGYR
jgi:tRNA(Leu) C34 or U34 (ribose-2'-O)-methylase TrmL